MQKQHGFNKIAIWTVSLDLNKKEIRIRDFIVGKDELYYWGCPTLTSWL